MERLKFIKCNYVDECVLREISIVRYQSSCDTATVLLRCIKR